MEDKIQFLKDFAFDLGSGAQLVLEGECGFGRECVGILVNYQWVGYDWDDDDFPVTAADAYHKHPCLAVLGRGDDAIEQLYEWCKALKEAGYNKVVVGMNPEFEAASQQSKMIMAMMGNNNVVTIQKG